MDGQEQCELSFLLKEAQPLELPYIPQLYSWVDWNNVGKVLAQGNTPGIEPESSGSQCIRYECFPMII